MLLSHFSKTLRHSVFFTAALAVTALAGPTQAKDIVKTCVAAPGAEQTATIVFHPRLFGVDGHEGDGDVFTDDFEHEFSYVITVSDYDQKKPGWTGPTRCSIKGSWRRDWNIPNIRPEFVTQDPGAIIYLRKVPRYSKVSLRLVAVELDDGPDDFLDFDPSPKGDFALNLDVFVNQKAAQTMVGKRQGRIDVTLNKAKRVIGDGRIGATDLERVRAFIEFVVNIHPDGWKSDPVMGKIAPGAIPGQAIPGKPSPNDHPQCRDYALKSVEQNKRQMALGCGFQPPVWSNDHQMHFDWCVQGNHLAATGAAIIARDAQLAQCMLERK
jgi:hypothetical protein